MNIKKVEKMLKAVQKGCSVRTLSVADIEMSIVRAEKKLKMMNIPKKYWSGTVVQMLPERVANNYRFPADGTYVTLKRLKTTWDIESVRRGQTSSCSGGSCERVKLILSDEAKLSISDIFI